MTLGIRPMTVEEMPFAIDLAAAEGWNPGLHDAAAFHATDPAGFLLGSLNDAPAGCISAVSYPGGFGFIGFYIVVPEHRGKGYGMQLWSAAMARLRDHNIGLDGVFEQQNNYRKSGFRLAYSNIRFESAAGESRAAGDANVHMLCASDCSAVAAYDRGCFPAERGGFLKRWLALPESRAFGFSDRGRLRGYSLIRRCRTGWKIGPLFADTAEIAERLFLQLRAVADGPVYLDVPEVNSAGMQLAERYGMKRVFGTARMYTGADPAIRIEGVFGVTTFELG